MIKFDYKDLLQFLSVKEIESYLPALQEAEKQLVNKTGPGSEFLGWMDLPVNYDREEFARMQICAERIGKQSEVLVVVGIGGSYLGAKAALDFLQDPLTQLKAAGEHKGPHVLFAGTQLSGRYLQSMLDFLQDRDFSINVISKSGTTTEPAIAFRFLRALMEKKYGKQEAAKRIYATTDKTKGALRSLADQEGYETFVVPDNVGGRFSVLTPVGLLPIAAAGYDVEAMLQGAAAMRERSSLPFGENPAQQYAAVRNALYNQNYLLELFVSYEQRLASIAEWWKQLYGESEGKGEQGLFPASVNFTADLHSLGQYIQDGKRHLFETVVQIETPDVDPIISADPQNLDGLNYLAGKGMDFVNKQACKGTIEAHLEGGVPNMQIQIDKANEYSLGELFYFFERACGLSAYVLGVNPFDQPGVEAYKKNMFRLLGKPA